MQNDRFWLNDFDALSPDKQIEVIDFIQFLKQKKQEAPAETARPSSDTGSPGPSFFDLAQDLIGSVKDTPSDLATNPIHMQGFGQ